MLLPPPPRKIARENPTLATAKKETLERLEAEKRTEQERIAAEQAAMTPQQRMAAAKAAEQAEQARLAAEQAEAAAQAAAEEERIAAELRQQGKTLVMKVHAFRSLATELGIKLTITQLKALDTLEYGTKAA
jgi:ABC-type ATPase involved in cell division